jgi:hypothetical protein
MLTPVVSPTISGVGAVGTDAKQAGSFVVKNTGSDTATEFEYAVIELP